MRKFLRVLRGPHGTLVILTIVGVVTLVGITTAFAAGGGLLEFMARNPR